MFKITVLCPDNRAIFLGGGQDDAVSQRKFLVMSEKRGIDRKRGIQFGDDSFHHQGDRLQGFMLPPLLENSFENLQADRRNNEMFGIFDSGCEKVGIRSIG